MLSCQRCKQTSNGPQAFLLTCRGCGKTWHHRCHMPPIEDDELIQRIRAKNTRDTANDLDAWTCRRCKKGISGTPSAMSSREPTVSSDPREKSSTSSRHGEAVTDITTSTSTSTSIASIASTVDVRVKLESSTAVDARLLNVRERNTKSERHESTEAAPAKRTVLTAKRIKPSIANPPHVQPQPAPAQPRDADIQMTDATPIRLTPQEKKALPQRPSSPTPFHQGRGARKSVSIVPATSSEDDVEMKVEVTPPSFSELTSRPAPQASQALPRDQAIRPKSVAEAPPRVHVASSTNEREREVRPADGAAIQLRVNQDAPNEINDDPDDLYGPSVERHIIRILPSLAEELREQRRRVAAEKEKRRAPLAPDWIYAKYMHDPLWKEIPADGRKRRKPIARKLGENGLDVNELMGCFAVQNWVREHKT